jgi:acyl-CoA dehydrogenase
MATQARWARFADGADEVHQWRIAQRAIESFTRTGSVNDAAGGLPL